MLFFRSRPVAEHAEVPLADEGRLETIIERFREADADGAGGATASYVVSVGSIRDSRIREAALSEIVNLVKSQGDRVVGSEICHLSQPNPRTLLGKGVAHEIAARAREHGATMIVVDA